MRHRFKDISWEQSEYFGPEVVGVIETLQNRKQENKLHVSLPVWMLSLSVHKCKSGKLIPMVAQEETIRGLKSNCGRNVGISCWDEVWTSRPSCLDRVKYSMNVVEMLCLQVGNSVRICDDAWAELFTIPPCFLDFIPHLWQQWGNSLLWGDTLATETWITLWAMAEAISWHR